jgi:lysophospholipase L1-like esterase
MKILSLFAAVAIMSAVMTGVEPGADSTTKTTKRVAKKKASSKKTPQSKTASNKIPAVKKSMRPVPVPASIRLSAHAEIEQRTAGATAAFEDAKPLEKFFARVRHAQQSGGTVHVLQFGDSHTASDDWVNSMRTVAQQMMGDGGPGFIQAGHPYKGYRRFDAMGANSTGWKTEGTMATREDPDQGLSGISISTEKAGQTVSLAASGETLGILYLRQPEGGEFELQVDDRIIATISTAGERGPGSYLAALIPGPHQLLLRTIDNAPVRLFGWTLDNQRGITFETLGINGAQANIMLEWNEVVWSAQVAGRNPALVILAYGTNEANSRKWTEGQYRADLLAVLDRVRRAAPAGSVLMVGPPDCGRAGPLLHLSEVIDIQREVARMQNVAFFDWRAHMGGAGMMKRWVQAGLAQADYIHLNSAGYQMLGKMLFDQLERTYSEFHE